MRIVFSIILILVIGADMSAQKEVKFSRQGNKEYKVNNFDDAELLYRRSFDENPSYSDAMFNLGNALYKQEKYQDALKSFETLANSEIDPGNKSDSYYNLGNSLLKDNKFKESIEAYKNSLRLNPDNLEAKYNLAYAQDQLQQQQQQQQNNQDKNNDQDKQEDNNKNQDKQDQQNQQDQQNNNSQQDQNKQQDKQQQQDKMSKQDAERLLQALAADEQKVQEKVKKARAAQKRVRTLKNW